MRGAAWIALALAALARPAAAQIDPRTAFLARAGWSALSTGEGRAATEAFREALTADPKNPLLHLGAALAASLEGRDVEAKDDCERALALDSSLYQARALLGQVRYRLKDLPGAIREYDVLVAQARDNERGAVRATRDRWQRELDLNDRMRQAVGSHFTVVFEGHAEAGLAAQAIESLDRAYWRISGVLSVFPAEPIRVVLYRSEQFRDITRSPAWAAGAYDGIIRVPMRGALEKPQELDRVLAHEFTHALVHTLAEHGVPAWLDEGLASALEGGDIDWAAQAATSPNPVPLRSLQNGFGRFTGEQAMYAYATSAVAARRLLDEAGGVAIANLLRDIGSGAAFEAAFLRRIQRPFADFQATVFEQ